MLRSAYCHIYGVVAGGAGGVGRGFCGGLDRAVSVGGADLDGVVARGGVPIVDVLAPGIFGELFGQVGRVPGLAGVGGDLDLLDAAVWGPGDTAYGVATGGEVVAVGYGVDAGLGLDRTLLGPGALDPVRVEVPVREFYLGEPLGSRDVSVEAGDDEPNRVAVFYRELAAVQAEGNQGVTAIQRDVRLEAGGKAVHATSYELPGGACDLVPAQTGLFEDIREQHPGPAPVGDEAAAHGVGDARECNVSLAGGQAEEVFVGELDGVVHGGHDRELPGVRVYPRRSERSIYELEAALLRYELGNTRH